MTKAEKKSIYDRRTIGYWSEMGGVEVKGFEYGIEDYCLCVVGSFTGNWTAHRLKIHYSGEDSYIVIRGRHLKFSECIRN